MATRIFITGNIYGAGNIGDDGILLGIVELLNDAITDARITIGTVDGEPLNFLGNGYEYAHSRNFTQVKQKIEKSDLIIIGGGTMIGDELSVLYPLRFVSRVLTMAKRKGKPVILFSIGANRLKTAKGRFFAKGIVDLADCIITRDPQSRAVCAALLRKDIQVGADPAFLLRPRKTKRTEKIIREVSDGRSVFGVNVVNEVWADEVEYKRVIADACTAIYERFSYIPVFFCNEVRHGRFFYQEANYQTAQMLRCPYKMIDPIYFSPDEMLEIISHFRFVLAMRMHVLIFASRVGVPFVAVSRVDKVDNFMQSFDLKSSGSVSECDSNRIAAEVERIVASRETISKYISIRSDAFADKARTMRTILKEFVEKNRGASVRLNIVSLWEFLAYNKILLYAYRLVSKTKRI